MKAGPRLGIMEFRTIAEAEVQAFFDEWRKKRVSDPQLYPNVMPEDEWWNELITYLQGEHK